MANVSEAKWPAAKVSLWPIGKIKIYPHNPRTHPPAQIELIARSMKEDGVTAPILVDEKGVIIYGHGRLAAARQCGFKRYPVAVARGWSDARKRAARIKDNQLATLSGWDAELMRFEVRELEAMDYDLGALGFGEAEMVQFIAGGPTAPDGFPAFDENIETEHQCPKCGYRWSGKSGVNGATK